MKDSEEKPLKNKENMENIAAKSKINKVKIYGAIILLISLIENLMSSLPKIYNELKQLGFSKEDIFNVLMMLFLLKSSKMIFIRYTIYLILADVLKMILNDEKISSSTQHFVRNLIKNL